MARGPSNSPSESSTSPVIAAGLRAMTATELAQKRARDRKAQQAMRDRNKDTIQTLTHQVAYLTHALECETHRSGELACKVQTLESENNGLRVQLAALRPATPMLPPVDSTLNNTPPWQVVPINTPPTCLSDQILQEFVQRQRTLHAGLTSDSQREYIGF
jgi:hypothetical protein